MAASNSTYLGGGQLFLKMAGALAFIELGLIQDLTIATAVETKKVLDKSGSIAQTFEEIMTKSEHTVKFSTQDISTDILRMMFLGTVTTAVVNPAVGLPGHVAGATTVTTIEAGKGGQWIGEMRFESNTAVGAERSVYFHKIALKPEGDLALIIDDFAKVTFSGTCVKNDTGKIITFGIAEA
jgi:hypothetical protein